MKDLTKILHNARHYQEMLRQSEEDRIFGRLTYFDSCIRNFAYEIGYTYCAVFDDLFVFRDMYNSYLILSITETRINVGIFDSLGEYFESFRDIYRADELIN